MATDLPDDGATLMYDLHDELFWRVSHEGDRVALYDRPTESVDDYAPYSVHSLTEWDDMVGDFIEVTAAARKRPVARLDNIVYEVGAQGARLTQTMYADFEWCKQQYDSGDGTDSPDDWPPSHQCEVNWPGGQKH